MDVEGIKREIGKLPKSDRSVLVTEVMVAFCREIFGDEACRDQLKELFGIDCLEKLDKRLETGI